MFLLIPYAAFLTIFSIYVINDWETEIGVLPMVFRIIILLFVAYFTFIEIK